MTNQIIRLFFFITAFVLVSGCNSEKQKSNVEKLPLPIHNLAPGTVQLCATVKDIQDKSDIFLTKVRVDTVFKYGQATPPLATNTSIEIEISKDVLGKSDLQLELNKLIYFELNFQKVLSLNNEGQGKWLVNKIASNKIF